MGFNYDTWIDIITLVPFFYTDQYVMENEKISVLIVDSDPVSLSQIKETAESNLLVFAVDTVFDSEQALLKIITKAPDLVVLEYPTVGRAGKEIIKYIQNNLEETTLVFLSASKEYAAIAIRHGVYNYLLKPVVKKDLDKILSKVHLINKTNHGIRIKQIINNSVEEKKLWLQTLRGYIILNPEEILYCKANGFYTEIFLTDDRNELSYIFISKLEEALKPYDFIRISRFYLLNNKFIRKVNKTNATIVLTSNGKEYEIKVSIHNIRNLLKSIPE